MRRKGQVAMEFIMTYGWAILVLLAAIGALAYFGVLSPSKYLPDKCLFTTGLNCKDFLLEDDGSNLDVQFTLTNNIGDGIIIKQDNITAEYRNGAAVTCDPDGTAGDATIGSGEEQGFTCPDLGPSPGAGQNAKIAVMVAYTTAQGVYPKTAVGEITGTVQ